MKLLIQNMVHCLNCGDDISSHSVHHFNSCTCGSCSVDGGLHYIRRSGDPKYMEEKSMYLEKDIINEAKATISDSTRNDYGKFLAVLRVLRKHDLLRMEKFGPNE